MMSKFKALRIITSISPIIVFLLVHIAFYWIAYNHNPFEPDYYKIYLSGFFQIYFFISLILLAGMIIRAKYFCSLFFVFALYGEIQMLFGYLRLGPHPTMGPAMMQFLLNITGFILGFIVEVTVRVISRNMQKRKQV